jgi:hypothetical protein
MQANVQRLARRIDETTRAEEGLLFHNSANGTALRRLLVNYRQQMLELRRRVRVYMLVQDAILFQHSILKNPVALVDGIQPGFSCVKFTVPTPINTTETKKWRQRIREGWTVEVSERAAHIVLMFGLRHPINIIPIVFGPNPEQLTPEGALQQIHTVQATLKRIFALIRDAAAPFNHMLRVDELLPEAMINETLTDPATIVCHRCFAQLPTEMFPRTAIGAFQKKCDRCFVTEMNRANPPARTLLPNGRRHVRPANNDPAAAEQRAVVTARRVAARRAAQPAARPVRRRLFVPSDDDEDDDDEDEDEDDDNAVVVRTVADSDHESDAEEAAMEEDNGQPRQIVPADLPVFAGERAPSSEDDGPSAIAPLLERELSALRSTWADDQNRWFYAREVPNCIICDWVAVGGTRYTRCGICQSTICWACCSSLEHAALQLMVDENPVNAPCPNPECRRTISSLVVVDGRVQTTRLHTVAIYTP